MAESDPSRPGPLGFFDRAIADEDRCLALDPAYENCRRWKALTTLFTGSRPAFTTVALLLMETLEGPPPQDLQQAILAVLSGGDPPANTRALVDREGDLAAEDDGLAATTVAFWDPAYTGLRGSPAFRHILDRLGISAYWRDHGYPPQCRPRGRDDFDCT